MVPFWVPIRIRHLIIRVPKKGTVILTTTHIINIMSSLGLQLLLQFEIHYLLLLLTAASTVTVTTETEQEGEDIASLTFSTSSCSPFREPAEVAALSHSPFSERSAELSQGVKHRPLDTYAHRRSAPQQYQGATAFYRPACAGSAHLLWHAEVPALPQAPKRTVLSSRSKRQRAPRERKARSASPIL